MQFLDTNVWVFAFTGESQQAVELVSDVLRGDAETVVDTYLYLEVISAFSHSDQLDYEEAQVAQDQFGQLLWGQRFETVHAEIDDSVIAGNVDLGGEVETFRTDSYNRLVAQILHIQAKDAPIVHLAYQVASDVRVFTNDAGFASLIPSDCSLPAISMGYVRRNPTATESTVSDAAFD